MFTKAATSVTLHRCELRQNARIAVRFNSKAVAATSVTNIKKTTIHTISHSHNQKSNIDAGHPKPDIQHHLFCDALGASQGSPRHREF